MLISMKEGLRNSTVIWFAFLSLFVLCILLMRYVVTIKRYVKELASAYDFVAKGKYDHKIHLTTTGDLGKAGMSFNLMTAQIKSNIEQLKDKNSKLHAILKSISNGIIVVDSEQNIMLMNKKAQDIWHCPEEYEGKPLFVNFKEDRLKSRVREMIYEEEEEAAQIESGAVWYKVKVDPVKIDGDSQIVIGNIINIEDVTERIKLEQMRRDFVANVSHELKTPLTSISGFVETLKNNQSIDQEKRNKFLNIIELESERLRRLIDDILTLSTIEHTKEHSESTVFLLEDLLEDCVRLIREVAESKKVSISFENRSSGLSMKSGADLIRQMVINLLDNGVKYSNEGGYVHLISSMTDYEVQIVVEDSGIGIPREDLPRIFERFYRVDKARSKKEGGTGLGLAIVKHSVIRLGGSVEVDSTSGKGTKFTVHLPRFME